MLQNSQNPYNDTEQVADAVAYLEDRFGVTLDGEALKQVSDDYWLVSEAGAAVSDELAAQTNGIRCVRELDVGFKPTTYALQYFDDRITRNRVVLTRDQFVTVLEGEMVPETAVEMVTDTSPGYVALVYDGAVIGCGLYKHEKVSSWIPKGRAQELLDVFLD